MKDIKIIKKRDQAPAKEIESLEELMVQWELTMQDVKRRFLSVFTYFDHQQKEFQRIARRLTK